MELPDLKKLDKLIALCRKRGVNTVRLGDLELTLGEAPAKERSAKSAPSTPAARDIQGEIESDGPKGEDLLFWSVGMIPEAGENTQQ